MYINFWYAVMPSEALGTDRPVRVKMLGQNFAVFRDSGGTARVVSDICIHRCASLSGGRVRGDAVECPYHGWQFDGDGQCTRIPSLGVDGKIPARARIDAYPTEERYGLVFAFLGDLPEAGRPPLMEIPEYGQEGWRCINLEYHWEANWARSIEAGLDPAHAEFVHSGMKFAGEDDEYAIPRDLEVKQEEWSTTMVAELRTIPLKKREDLGNADLTSVKPEAGLTRATSIFHGPTCTITRINFGPGQEVCQYMWETPEDEFHVAKHLVSVRSIMASPSFDASFNQRNLFVADEDKVVIERVDPMVFPDSNTREVLVPADRQIGLYRQYLKRWEAMGWRIDSRQVDMDRGRIAYAIPSPARRGPGSWALPTVPMISPAAEEREAGAA
jgi:phenylpropionate dioxygenase-like ring-hydroxylating dioxygenase large terminal subunit